MVSLGNDRNTGGGFFFSTDVGSSIEDTADDTSLLSSTFITDNEPRFKTFPLVGWIASVVQIITIPCILGTVLSNGTECFYMIVAHIAAWCVFLLTACILHHSNGVMKRYGYLDFYRHTRIVIKLPFVIVSLGSVALLGFLGACDKYDLKTCQGSSWKCETWVMIICCVESVVLLPFLVGYLWILVRFHRAKALPDVHNDDLLIMCIQSQSPNNEIGFKDEDYKGEVLEKQADMIRYLRQHNIYLSRKILKLTSELNSFKVDARA